MFFLNSTLCSSLSVVELLSSQILLTSLDIDICFWLSGWVVNVFCLIWGGVGGGGVILFSFSFGQAHGAGLLFRSINRHLSLQWTMTIVTITQYWPLSVVKLLGSECCLLRLVHIHVYFLLLLSSNVQLQQDEDSDAFGAC